MTIRPNLAPLVVAPAVAMLLSARTTGWTGLWPRAAAFFVAAALGPAMVLWAYAALYGSPAQSGYQGADAFFAQAHLWTNVQTYPRLFVDTLGWGLPMLAGLGAVAWRWAPAAVRTQAVEAGTIILVNVLLYLWYLPYDHWPFLRFFLPATTALGVAGSALVVSAAHRLPRPAHQWARIVPLTLVVAAAWHGRAESSFALNDWRGQRRVLRMGHYLREALPANGVAIAYAHSGAIAHYTGRLVVTPERLTGESLDRLVQTLHQHGFKPFLVVDEQLEEPQYRRAFAGSQYGALDWPARAEFVSTARIRLFDPSDRARHQRGERWATDVLR